MNTGERRRCARTRGLLTTVAWQLGGKTTYALEGASFIAGAAVQWLRDGLGLIKKAADIEALAAAVKDTGDVVFVPGARRPGRAALAARGARARSRASTAAPPRRTSRARRSRASRCRSTTSPRRCAQDSGRDIPGVQGGRRRGGQRPADAVPGGRARRAGGAARRIWRPPRWARRSSAAWARASGRARRRSAGRGRRTRPSSRR